MRVVALVPGDDFSGPGGQVASTAVELAKEAVEVYFLLLCRPGTATGRLPTFLDRHNLAYEVLDDRGPLDLGLVLRVRRRLSVLHPTILETHGYKATAIASLLRRMDHPWRWVGFFHGLTHESRRARFYHWLDRQMLRRADRVVAISEDQRRTLLSDIPNTVVIHSAVTILAGTHVDDSAGTLDRLKTLPSPRLAVVGRLSPEKGVDVFLRAAGLLMRRGLSFSAVVVGDGPERSKLDHLSKSLGLRDRVYFLGHIPAIGDVYQTVDMVVIPSRSEGLPSVLLEALSADLPVVSTRVGAVPEVIRAPEAGILVRPGSPGDLADGIEAGLASLSTETARRARAAAAQSFSRSRRAQSLLALYRQLLEAPADEN